MLYLCDDARSFSQYSLAQLMSENLKKNRSCGSSVMYPNLSEPCKLTPFTAAALSQLGQFYFTLVRRQTLLDEDVDDVWLEA